MEITFLMQQRRLNMKIPSKYQEEVKEIIQKVASLFQGKIETYEVIPNKLSVTVHFYWEEDVNCNIFLEEYITDYKYINELEEYLYEDIVNNDTIDIYDLIDSDYTTQQIISSFENEIEDVINKSNEMAKILEINEDDFWDYIDTKAKDKNENKE